MIEAQETIPVQVRREVGGRYRIAVVTSAHPNFDSRLWKYAKLLGQMGHSVVLVCPWDVPDGESREGVQFRTFIPAISRSQRWKTPFRLYRRLFPLLSELDIIHFHDLDILPWMTAISVFKHVIYDVHENYPTEMLGKEWIPRPLRRSLAFTVRWGQLLCANILRNVVLVAKSQEKDLFGPRLRKTYVMNYASTDLLDRLKHDYPSRPASVIFTGSQHLNTGSLLYLEIAALIHAQRRNVIFYATERFGGNTSFRQQVLDEVAARGLQDVYHLLPNVQPHELMSSLNMATIAISPNLRIKQQIDGVHTKLFEYMAAGLPIVASDLPHQVEVIGGNEAGLLAQPEDPETFARAILRLIDDRDLAYQLGQNGTKAFLEKYSWESQTAAIGDYYRSIIGYRLLDVPAR